MPIAAAMAAGLLMVPWLTASPDGAVPAQPCGVMQVVAHEDDDLLFMNPDIDSTAAAHQCQVTVFITAGNGQPTVRHRQRGIQDAYRVIGGVNDQPDQAEWDRDLTSFNGHQVEVFTLRDNPNVRLLFMNLPDPTATAAIGQHSLSYLLANASASTTSSVPCYGEPTGYTDDQCYAQPVQASTYNAGKLTITLATIMRHYRPHTIRLQDPDPDLRYHPTGPNSSADHPDHVAAAEFTQAAADQAGIGANLVYYRDYNINQSPTDLATAGCDRKTTEFTNEYAPLAYDQVNHKPITDQYIAQWVQAMYYRWPRGTGWVGSNADGRLQAFNVRSGQVYTVFETSPGNWSAETSLGAPPSGGVFPAISTAQNADGRLEIFALGYDYHVVTKYQTTVNGNWSAQWDDLGTPSPGSRTAAKQVGVPVAVTNADGTIQLFMKNGGGGLSSTWQQVTTDGRFGPWTDFGHGPAIQDPVTAVQAAGRIWVVAATTNPGGVLTWRQTDPSGPLTFDTTFTFAPAGPPSAGVNADGRVETQFRHPGTAGTFDTEVQTGDPQTPPTLTWKPLGNIGGQGGVGPSSMYTPIGTGRRRIVAVSRNTGGGVSFNVQSSENGPYAGWKDLGSGVPLVDYPVVADSGSRISVLAIGIDGHFWLRRQSSSSLDATFDPWKQIGG